MKSQTSNNFILAALFFLSVTSISSSIGNLTQEDKIKALEDRVQQLEAKCQ